MPASAPLLRPVFGVHVSPVGQVMKEASGVLVNEDALVEDIEVGDVEVGEGELEPEEDAEFDVTEFANKVNLSGEGASNVSWFWIGAIKATGAITARPQASRTVVDNILRVVVG